MKYIFDPENETLSNQYISPTELDLTKFNYTEIIKFKENNETDSSTAKKIRSHQLILTKTQDVKLETDFTSENIDANLISLIEENCGVDFNSYIEQSIEQTKELFKTSYGLPEYDSCDLFVIIQEQPVFGIVYTGTTKKKKQYSGKQVNDKANEDPLQVENFTIQFTFAYEDGFLQQAFVATILPPSDYNQMYNTFINTPNIFHTKLI